MESPEGLGREEMNLATTLHLERPLAVLDVETTGTNPGQDRIVQIAITIHYPDKEPIPWCGYVNPTISIPPEATAVHHITDEMVKEAPTFRTMAPKLAKALSGIDFAGYNVLFDLKVIYAEMKRAGQVWEYESAAIIDAYRIEQILHPRDLSTVYEKLTGEKFPDAHDAGADVAATERVLQEYLQQHSIPRTVAELNAYCWPKSADSVDASGKIVWRSGVACLGFGKKFNGTPLQQVDKGYLQWMIANDFPADTKRICEEALSGVYPTK